MAAGVSVRPHGRRPESAFRALIAVQGGADDAQDERARLITSLIPSSGANITLRAAGAGRHGFFHAGVMGALSDNAGGDAAHTRDVRDQGR
jgi:hypothetical protein